MEHRVGDLNSFLAMVVAEVGEVLRERGEWRFYLDRMPRQRDATPAHSGQDDSPHDEEVKQIASALMALGQSVKATW